MCDDDFGCIYLDEFDLPNCYDDFDFDDDEEEAMGDGVQSKSYIDS